MVTGGGPVLREAPTCQVSQLKWLAVTGVLISCQTSWRIWAYRYTDILIYHKSIIYHYISSILYENLFLIRLLYIHVYIYININVYIPINYTQLAIAAKARWKMVDIPFPPCDRRRQSKGSSEGQEKLDQAKIDETLGTLWDMLGIWSGSDFVFLHGQSWYGWMI